MLRSCIVLLACCVTLYVGYDIPTWCEQNEELKCMKPCIREKTCKNRQNIDHCTTVHHYEPCQIKCVCKEGHYRNPLGSCLTQDQCMQCKGDNEFFACDSVCDNVCATIHEKNRTHCPIQNVVCKQKCYCNDGYARSKTGDCIPLENCDGHYFLDAIAAFEKKEAEKAWSAFLPGPHPTDHCTGPNEFFACDSACDNECTTLNEQNRTHCPAKSMLCKPRCYCEDGYARDEKGVCIPQESCPPLPQCEGINEEYTRCKLICSPQLCSSTSPHFNCDTSLPCEAGCQCKEGFLKPHENGPCIPICDCPEMKYAIECLKNFHIGFS